MEGIMNIFILDADFETNAKYHCDKHVVKMITEHNQILSTVHWLSGSYAPYKATHINHPCCIWARKSLDNYVYLCWLNIYLCREYTHRYNKTHAGELVVNELRTKFPNIPIIGLTPFAQAMPDDVKDSNPITAYRNYYKKHKQHIASWKNREVPEWFRT